MKTIGLIFSKPAPDAELFICPHCGREYKSEAALEKHLEKEHTEVTGNDGADGKV